MKTYSFNKSTFRMESKPIHIKMQFGTGNCNDFGIKRHVA